MSALYFHSPSGTCEIPGPEYHYLRGLVYDLACGILQPISHQDELPRFISRAHHLAGRGSYDLQWSVSVELAFRTEAGGCSLLSYRDRPLPAFALALNTVMAAGSDVIRLAARLAAQAEIHAWAEGEDRGWLAGLIDEGVHAGLLRSGLWRADVHGVPESWSSSGWDALAVFLRARDDEPVVTSYSVEGGFPAAEASDWLPPLPEGVTSEADLPERERDAREARCDAWAGLSGAEQWQLGMAWLRANPGLQMTPDYWEDVRFGAGLSLFDLYAADAEPRLDRTLGLSQ